MRRKGMAWSCGRVFCGVPSRSLGALILAAGCAASAVAADYEFRLVPFDSPDTAVEDRLRAENDGSYWQLYHSLTYAQRKKFVPPYSCWVRNVRLNDAPLFEIYKGTKYVTRRSRVHRGLNPGKYTIWPGDHVFTVEKDGTPKTEDAELIVGTEPLEDGTVHVVRIKCYPVTIKAENADPRAAKPTSLLEEIPLPHLTIRESADNEAAMARDKLAEEKKDQDEVSSARELLPQSGRFLTLRAWLPANSVGKGYVIHPLRETFHVGAAGIITGAGGGHRTPGWRIEGCNIVIPITRIPAMGEKGMQIVIADIQDVSGFTERDPVLFANLYARREPYEFRVSPGGPPLIIDGDLSKLPNKLFRVDWADPEHTRQRGLIVETGARHLEVGQEFRVRIRGLDPTEADSAERTAEKALELADAAAEQVPKAQSNLEKAKGESAAAQRTLDDAVKELAAAQAGPKSEIEKAQRARDAAQSRLNDAKDKVIRAERALAAAGEQNEKAQTHAAEAAEKAKAVAGRNPLAGCTPFVRLQAYGSDDWVELATRPGPEETIVVSLAGITDGVYRMRAGLLPPTPGKKYFFVDQWVTVAAGNANGVGVLTQRGRSAFYRGESFWLGVGVMAAAGPVSADTPLTVDLIDSQNVVIPLYRGTAGKEISERDTIILNVSSATSAGLAPGRYRVDARAAGRGGPPFHIYIVDAAPETHFTKLLLGKYNAFGPLYGTCLNSKKESPGQIARAIAESGYNAFKGMTYAMDRVGWPDRSLAELVRERPELGPWEAYAPSSGRDQFLDAAVRHNIRFWENLFTQHDTMMPRGDKMLEACERFTVLEAQSMRHNPAFQGVCLYDEFSQSLDHDTSADVMAYFHRADDVNYRRKHNGRPPSAALRARDRFMSRQEGQRDYEDIELYRTWPRHLDDQWEEFSARMGGAVRMIMPEAVNFTLARIGALPGGNVGSGVGSWEGIFRPLQAAATVGYKDMGGWGAFACAGPICADALRTRDDLLVWPTIYGVGTGRYDASNLRQAFFTLSQKCHGLSFMQFRSVPETSLGPGDYWGHSHYPVLRDILGVLCTRYGDLILAAERGYKKVAIYYSREMSHVSDTSLACEGLWTACMRAGFPADFLTDSQVRAGTGMEYDVIFVPGIRHREAVPPDTLAALRRLKTAKKIIATEPGSRLNLDGLETTEMGFGEIAGGATFPKHLDHDDERWWERTEKTTAMIKSFLAGFVTPAARHDLLVGPDWLRCRQGQYMVIPNQAATQFTGNHKTLFQAPDRPTVGIPMERFPNGLPACYDMLEMEAVSIAPGPDGKIIPISVDFRYYPGKIYAFLPAAIESVVVRFAKTTQSAQSTTPGNTLSYEAFVTDVNDRMVDAGIPLEITLTAPSGAMLQKIYRAGAPTYRGAYRIPLNIGTGSLRLRVRELISGRVAEAAVDVTEAVLPSATPDTRTARICDAERIHEFLKTGIAAARPLFKEEDLLHPGRLAARIRDGEDALCKYLRERFAPATRELLEAYDGEGEASKELTNALVGELNKVVEGGHFYTDELFPLGILSVEAGRLGQITKEADKLVDVNRLLLEDYYAREIVMRPPVFIAADEPWVRPQAERLGRALQKMGRRVRVAAMQPYRRGAGAITVGETAGELTLDAIRLWRGEVVSPGVFVDGPLILLGGRRNMIELLADRDLLPEPVSQNFPGPGKAILSWVHQAFSTQYDTVAVMATDVAGLRCGIDALIAIDAKTASARPAHPTAELSRFDEKAAFRSVSGKERQPMSFRDSISQGDRVVTMDTDPATGRILVGTFGFGHNLFCFSPDGQLVWKTFLPEHDVYLARWYDGGKRVLASTSQGFYVFIINGDTGKVDRKLASSEWPDFHSDREFATMVKVTFNPKARQVLILGRTGVLAVKYDGDKMWFYDRAREIVEYPSMAVQTAYACFGQYVKLSDIVSSPDGTRLAYNEFRYFASTKGLLGPEPLWRNEPKILDARTGKILLDNYTDQGSNDLWKITWPGDSPDPWIHAGNLSAPLQFTGKGDPDPGRLGTFVPPANPQLKTGGGWLHKDYNFASRTGPEGRTLWTIRDENFWVEELDRLNADDTRLYRCSRDGLVRCIDVGTGTTVWEHKLQFVARLFLAPEDNLLAGTRNGEIVRFGADGRVLWERRLRNLHEIPDGNYAEYIARAKRRDRDDTAMYYPVFKDGPDDFKGILRMGIEQLDNGGFELDNEYKLDGEIKKHWQTASGEGRFATVAREGKRSLQLDKATLVTCSVQRKVIPSATYLLEFYYRTEARDTRLAAGACLKPEKEEEPQKGETEAAGRSKEGQGGGQEDEPEAVLTVSIFKAKPGEWAFGRVAIKSAAATRAIDVGFEADGRAYVDCVSLRTVRFPSANLLANAELHREPVTHPEDHRIRYSRIRPRLRQKLLNENNVTVFLQATPLGSLIFTQEQAFLHNGWLDDIDTMWCYRPEPVGFSVILTRPAYVSHLVIYLNNTVPETVYHNIAILANDMVTKLPKTVGLVRGNRRRFIVVHFPETLFTDNLKILPGKYRCQRDSITEIEVYGPVGGPMRQARFSDDKLATPMLMGAPSHVQPSLREDFAGEYTQQRRSTWRAPALHAGATVVDEALTFALATGSIEYVPVTAEAKDALNREQWAFQQQGLKLPGGGPMPFFKGWKTGTATPLTTPARYAGRLFAGSADYKMHAVADNGAHIWAFETGGRVYSSPTPDGDEVYFGSDDGNLYKVDIDSGILIWEFKTGGRIRSSPAVDGGKVYAASWDGFLYAVDTIRGTEVWRAPIGLYTRSSPAVHDGCVYVGDEDGNLHCFDAGNGKPVWEKAAIGGQISMCPVVTPEGVFVAAESGSGALVGADGKLRWQRNVFGSTGAADDVPPRLTGQPFATRTQLLLPSTKGLLVLRRADGAPDGRFLHPLPGKNIVSAVPYGERLCLIENGIRLEGDWTRFVVRHTADVVVLEPKATQTQ